MHAAFFLKKIVGVESLFNNQTTRWLARFFLGIVTAAISQQHNTAGCLIFRNIPFFHQLLTKFIFKGFFSPCDNTGRNSQISCLKHNVFCTAKSIRNTVYKVFQSKHHTDGRRTVKTAFNIGIIHNTGLIIRNMRAFQKSAVQTGGIQASQLLNKVSILYRNNFAALSAAGIGSKKSRFQDFIQILLTDLPILIFADRTAMFH